jgi:hypothetical protein
MNFLVDGQLKGLRDRPVRGVYVFHMSETAYMAISILAGVGTAALAAWRLRTRCAP